MILIELQEKIKNYISGVDFVEFSKWKWKPIYIDLVDWTTKQVWYLFRIVMESEGKKYRGNCWVNIEQINDFNF